MALRVGQILRGVKGTYQLSQSLKDLTVFKAKVLSSTSGQAKWYNIQARDNEQWPLTSLQGYGEDCVY